MKRLILWLRHLFTPGPDRYSYNPSPPPLRLGGPYRGLQSMDVIERRFVQRMRAELAANRHKADWRYMTLWEARAELKQHQKKLDKAVLTEDAAAIKEYAADVANCAMFVAWAAGLLAQEDDSPGNRGQVFGPHALSYG
jgi:acyl-CoA reductase-like NAD-dependent aldehyde dehydrogenase